MKRLYFGDCLDVLKELCTEYPQGFIDLIYIDPPFNSKRDYNVLFEPMVGDATAQKQAFADTWSNVSYLDTLNEIQELDLDLYQFLQSLDSIRTPKSTVAYLTTMAIRIHYMSKVLKKTGTFFLHCDPTVSHYLKLVCDLVFSENNFRNEIAWQRSSTRSSISKIFRRAHDVILFYSRSEEYSFNLQYKELSEASKTLYTKKDSKGFYQTVPLLVSGKRNGETGKPWRGIDPNKFGKEGMHWITTHANLDKYDKGGLVYWATKGHKQPRLKYYLNDNLGVPMSDLWTDIRIASKNESLGYPTQKPEELLERIIRASSREGDLVADFFCGCGTTIAVAQRLKRNWMGVDISHLAIRLILERLTKPYRNNKENIKKILHSIEIRGLPKDVASARELATRGTDGRFRFQDWAIEVMLGGVSNIKKVAEGGFDGYLTFNKREKQRELVIIQVKSGHCDVTKIREFIQVVQAQKAAIGAFVCFKENVTKPMLLEAKKQGYYDSKSWGNRFDKIQIITVEELFNGQRIEHPESTKTTFKGATKKTHAENPNETLL